MARDARVRIYTRRESQGGRQRNRWREREREGERTCDLMSNECASARLDRNALLTGCHRVCVAAASERWECTRQLTPRRFNARAIQFRSIPSEHTLSAALSPSLLPPTRSLAPPRYAFAPAKFWSGKAFFLTDLGELSPGRTAKCLMRKCARETRSAARILRVAGAARRKEIMYSL